MRVLQMSTGESCVRRGRGPGRRRSGFSLGEMIVTVIIGAMVLTAILGIYGRANRAADAVLKKIESPSLAAEVLQLITEDLGRTLGADDVSLRVRNGFDNGFHRAELVLRRTFHDSENKEQTLEEIIWRAAYDHGGRTPGLVLYRSHDGVAQEDKLLDDNRDTWEKNYPFVPICRGITFFQVQACKGDDFVDQWATPALPPGVKVTLSFAEPYETVRGTWDVMDDEKVSRTIAVDGTRKIKFTMPAGFDPNESQDPNGQVSGDRATEEGAAGSRTTDERAPAGRTSGRATGERTINEPTPRQTRSRPR
jgi:hypothetical protein